MNYEREHELAKVAALKAGEAIMAVYATAFKVDHKSPEQPITEADRQANQIIQKTLLDAFPDDGWLSEETLDNHERLKKKRVWIVDPLDGTKEFINHIPEFAVSIGLSVDGEAVVGAIYNPSTKELFHGFQGGGAFLNGEKISVSKTTDLANAKILASRSEIKRGEWENFDKKFDVIKSGGMAHKMSVVVRGMADGSFSLSPKNEWDFAGGTLLMQEAGGIVSHKDGSPITFNKDNPRTGDIVYGNKSIHKQLLDILHGR